MDEAIISWNIPNAVTIFLMAVIGFLLFGAVVSAMRRLGGKNDG